MQIRALTSKDVAAVEAIFDMYWHDDFREHLSEQLENFVTKDPQIVGQDFQYFVADDDGEVVGIAALRKAPAHMKLYTHTLNPAEFYILAVKTKGKGIGTMLREVRIEEAKKRGYTEVVFFSGETHKDSWDFHDQSDFKRVAEALAPNGEPGYIWSMVLE